MGWRKGDFPQLRGDNRGATWALIGLHNDLAMRGGFELSFGIID